ncbi:AlpA family phage regulatory protein [Salmonella enterica subsp. enterica]|nr:AlpA family phage regulatory protein [Salmonella enterica subsp. enterica]ECI7957016.1 AlpA family phage regulatory protein [Salmonella enterica subsp. enterica]ECJ5065655.1 AlpA family phage regulatory protein [Salmonella enterica subsp. enterica]EDT8008638.1 AlpA family phage regulatory protein [Salmonella enterica subsp. enterica]
MQKKSFNPVLAHEDAPKPFLYHPPVDEQRRYVLDAYGFKYDRRIREDECSEITSLSRSTRWKMEQEGRFPPRCHFGRNSCAWLLSDVLWWVRNPPAVENVNNPSSRKSA